MKYVFSMMVIFVLLVSFAQAQELTYEIQISGTYEAVDGGPKKWTNWVTLDHALITFGTESVPNADIPDEISIDGDLQQDWFIDFDATGEGQRLVTFIFDRATMPYLTRKGLIGYAFRYRVNANQKFSPIDSQFIDDTPGKSVKVD